VGGLVSFLGISLLVEWVYQSWFNLSRIDYLIVVTILLVIATIGFLEGVILGIVLAVVLFVVNYSQINVLKHAGSGIEFRSRLTRSPHLQDFLDQRCGQIYILQLQGFIFFGTANALLKQIEARIDRTDLPRLTYLVIDFREVTGLDSTARYSFFKLIQIIQARKLHLVLTHSKVEHPLPGQKQSIAEFFLRLQATGSREGKQPISIFSDLDHGLEWCENEILMAAGFELEDDQTSLTGMLQSLMSEAVSVKPVLKYFEPLELDSGHSLIKQGDPPGAIYFIESGQVTAQFEFSNEQRQTIRLETMRGGHMVGEIGFYLNQPRTAAVVTDKPSTVYRLTRQALSEMERDDPEAASLFHQLVIRLISRRLEHLINTVNALQR
jgi:SulP family sulfate permease